MKLLVPNGKPPKIKPSLFNIELESLLKVPANFFRISNSSPSITSLYKILVFSILNSKPAFAKAIFKFV